MQEEETAATKTKRAAEDTEPEAKRPRVGAEPAGGLGVGGGRICIDAVQGADRKSPVACATTSAT